jgi:short subunit dehydrogenase-like uncharacterized protein
MNSTQFTITLFGASSFVGRIVARHIQDLIEQQSTCLPEGFNWAIAGRDESHLLQIKQDLGASADALSVIVADAKDENQLRIMCAQSKLVISTVGPYALYGELLVKVCAETGTDYCDLTGEVQWIRRMLDRYQASAKHSCARIVHCCGFDAIPSDLGVYFTQQHCIENFGHPCATVKMAVKSMAGTFSGGTLASMINLTKEAVGDSTLRKNLANPYWLCPDNHAFTTRQPSSKTDFDQHFDSWTAPFVMAGINTRIVHRSNALLNNLYGNYFVYSEVSLTRNKWRSRLLRLGLAVFSICIALPPTRWLAQTFLLPKPGEGPTPKQQREGSFDIRFVGVDSNGSGIRTQVCGDRDPGYGSTAKMLTQAALCLAVDVDDTKAGGFYTPASLFGNALIERLSRYAGVTFTRLDS